MEEAKLRELVKPLAGTNPCGIDLSDRDEFLKLEAEVQGKVSLQTRDKVPQQVKEPPNWPKVQTESMRLLLQSKDLRLVRFFCLARLHLDGIQGLCDGLFVFRHLLTDAFWPALYPPLDTKRKEGYGRRINVLAALAGDPTSAQDWMTCRTKLEELASLPPVRREDDAASSVARGHLRAINQFLENKIGADPVPGLSKVDALLQRMANGGEGSSESGSVENTSSVEQRNSGGGSGTGAMVIQSRADVIRALERICAFYKGYEPTSPILMLVKWVRGFMDLGYAEIHSRLTKEIIAEIKKPADAQPKPEPTEK